MLTIGPFPRRARLRRILRAASTSAKGDHMSCRSRIFAAIAIAVAWSGPALSQGLVTQRNLSLAMAKAIAEGTLAECKSKGFSTAAAVVDRAGQIMVLL